MEFTGQIRLALYSFKDNWNMGDAKRPGPRFATTDLAFQVKPLHRLV